MRISVLSFLLVFIFSFSATARSADLSIANVLALPSAMNSLTNWEIQSGSFSESEGKIVSSGRGMESILSYLSPDLSRQTLEATLAPSSTSEPKGYHYAGLALMTDGNNFWHLALVESPTGMRYAELSEMMDGVWQAQNEAGSRLSALSGAISDFSWEPDRPYRLKIVLSSESIVGAIEDADGKPVYRLEYAFSGSTPAVKSGRLALQSSEMKAAFSALNASGMGSGTSSVPVKKGYAVAVQNLPGIAPLRQSLKKAGYNVTPITEAQMGDDRFLSARRFDVLLLPDASLCPIRAKDILLHYLRDGGDLIVVGGPIFEKSRTKATQDWEHALSGIKSDQSLLDFNDETIRGWHRSSNEMGIVSKWGVTPSGAKGIPAALHADIADLNGWDTYSTELTRPFPAGDDLTQFWAKGDANTTHLIVEWKEKDGSRWIATVPITTEWKRCTLSPDDFNFWNDNVAKGRGSAGDRLHPENAVTFSVGLARSHANYPNGPHSFWIAGISAGKLPEGLKKPDLTIPNLELFSPFYKHYQLPSLHPKTKALEAASSTGDQTGSVFVPIPRPRGLGIGGKLRGRWIPLVEIKDDTGKWRGSRESLYVNLGLPYRGSVWGQIAGEDSPSRLASAIASQLKRMKYGLFLARGGAEFFSYFTDQTMSLGAQAVNLSAKSRNASIKLKIVADGETKPIFKWMKSLDLYAGASIKEETQFKAESVKPGAYRAITELYVGKALIDQIDQPISILSTPEAPHSDFIFVKNGNFWNPRAVDAEKSASLVQWHPYGANYWQTNVAGADVADYWLHWLSPVYYDPTVIERDLTTLRGLGFTSLSVQLNDRENVPQVNDFIRRAARHGLKINLFLAGAHPFDTDEALFTDLIKNGRFAGNPGVWAYDLAWEHHLGGHDDRAKWDGEWEAWVINHYGSIQHAEEAWGYPIPRDADGKVTNPPDAQLRQDGPWLKMAVAYERCADDVISRHYGRVIRKIRSLDPNHLVSARSASQPSWTGWFAYDLVSSGKQFDFSSPEGYGLKPDEAGFTVAYGRYAGNGKPVFWAEFGASIFPYDANGAEEKIQSDLHDGFGKMLLDSGANGLASWWSVGGYRVDERSDFGILSPDGMPRASALALQKYAKRVTSPRVIPTPTVWTTIDRDLHAAAYQEVFESHKKEYIDALHQGKMLGVRTEGTGTDSSNCPLLAVGNLPYGGFDPLKFLNAEFNRLEIKDASGEWRAAEDGATINVTANAPIEARASAGNNGDASWLSGDATGSVSLIGDDRADERANSSVPQLSFRAPLPRDIKRYEDVEFPSFVISPGIGGDADAVFVFESKDRARFGDRRRIHLKTASE